jgi:YggT family protein|tara:strand:- start:300 stop:599 length:300 start_codon:yes stop_codon:yes gene_type:complete
MYIIGYPLLALVNMTDTLLFLYSIVVFVVCLMSFVNPDPSMPLVKILNKLTQPVFAIFRKYVPAVNGIDLAPLVVLLAIMFVRSGILPIFTTFASDLIK